MINTFPSRRLKNFEWFLRGNFLVEKWGTVYVFRLIGAKKLFQVKLQQFKTQHNDPSTLFE